MNDIATAVRIRDAVHASLDAAYGRVLDAGWTIDRMRITNDCTRGTCMQLQLNTEGDTWWSVFEVMLTFDIGHDRACVNVIERWQREIPTAPAFDPDVVDRTALARMFPDWEAPRSMRGRATRGVIKT